jgi:hypothetical protein
VRRIGREHSPAGGKLGHPVHGQPGRDFRGSLGNEIIMAARAHWFEDDASASGSEDKPAKTEEAADAESSK